MLLLSSKWDCLKIKGKKNAKKSWNEISSVFSILEDISMTSDALDTSLDEWILN